MKTLKNFINESALVKQQLKDMDGADYNKLKNRFQSIADAAHMDIDDSGIDSALIRKELKELKKAQDVFARSLKKLSLSKYL